MNYIPPFWRSEIKMSVKRQKECGAQQGIGRLHEALLGTEGLAAGEILFFSQNPSVLQPGINTLTSGVALNSVPPGFAQQLPYSELCTHVPDYKDKPIKSILLQYMVYFKANACLSCMTFKCHFSSGCCSRNLEDLLL